MKKINFKVKYEKTNGMELILNHSVYVTNEDTVGSTVEKVLDTMESVTIRFLVCTEYIIKGVVMESDIDYLKGLKVALEDIRILGDSHKYQSLLSSAIVDYINDANICDVDDYMTEWEQIEYTEKTVRKLSKDLDGKEFYRQHVQQYIKD